MVRRRAKAAEKGSATEESNREARRVASLENWKPKTGLGRLVKTGQIKDIDEILAQGLTILEPEIVDTLIPALESELLMVGQSKGKFGGGKASIWRQTQKKTKEGNRPKFATVALAGDKNGHVGLGFGKAKETVPAREKAIRKSKLNLISIKRGCGSWECACGTQHSVPFMIRGKSGSVEFELIPAPKGTGLCVQKECKKILTFAGFKDLYSRTFGNTSTKINLLYACFDALNKLSKVKMKPEDFEKLGVGVQGAQEYELQGVQEHGMQEHGPQEVKGQELQKPEKQEERKQEPENQEPKKQENKKQQNG